MESKAFSIDSNSWADSTLRAWLNEIFINDAFSSEETNSIEKTKIASDSNSGKSSEDLVFILSASEAEKYFSSDNDRKLIGSDYADANGLLVSKTGYCRWWLRTPGAAANMMSVINGDGVIDTYGCVVTENTYGVRPAMWVKTAGITVVDPDIMNDIIATAEIKASDSAAQASPSGIMYSKVDELMVRTGPGQNYNAVAKLYAGDGVTVIEIVDGWAHILYGGGDFWVSAQYLTEIPDACFEALRKSAIGAEAFNYGWNGQPKYIDEDASYFYFQVFYGGGWKFVKVQRTAPYTVSER